MHLAAPSAAAAQQQQHSYSSTAVAQQQHSSSTAAAQQHLSSLAQPSRTSDPPTQYPTLTTPTPCHRISSFQDCKESPQPYEFPLDPITAISRDDTIRQIYVLVTMYNADTDSGQYNQVFLNNNFLGIAGGVADTYSQTQFMLSPSEYTLANLAGESAGVNKITVVNQNLLGGWFTCTNWAQLVVRVNFPPVVPNKNFTVLEDGQLDIEAAEGLLAGAYDLDPEDTLSIVGFTLPGHGNVAVESNGSFVFTPEPNWYGKDSFNFTVTDGAGANTTATVDIVIGECLWEDRCGWMAIRLCFGASLLAIFRVNNLCV